MYIYLVYTVIVRLLRVNIYRSGKITTDPSESAARIVKTVWRNDNETDPSDQMTHKLYKVVCASVPNVMPNRGGVEREGVYVVYVIEKVNENENEIGAQQNCGGGCFLRQQQRL